jgi:hypothetical protein
VGELTLSNANAVTVNDVDVPNRVFETNHCLLFKCAVSQNRKDGVKNKDYKLQVLGCKIQGNTSNAISLTLPTATSTFYFKEKSNEPDITGKLQSSSGARYRPTVVFEPNLATSFKQLIESQFATIYSQMVKLSALENQSKQKVDVV